MTNDCICSNVPRIWRLAGVTRTVRLTVTKDGSPYDFTGLQTVLRIDRDNSDFHYEPQFTVEGDDNNIIVFTWAADKQPLGDYTIEVAVTDGSGNMDRVNWHGATGVRLVEYSNLVKGEDAAGVESDSELGLDGIFTMNGTGMSAYDEWLAQGHTGTEADYIAWMQQPAREAASDAEAAMIVIQARADEDHATAESDHTTAGNDHTRAAQDHTTAVEDHEAAISDHTQAGQDHERAETDHTTAQADHVTAGNDHTQAAADHATAAADHSTAASDHTKATQDSTRAGSDHDIAVADHAQAEADHTRAEGDHTLAAADHTTAASDHTIAASDHTTAAADHTQAVADHAVMAGYDTRLTNVETDVTQLGQEMTEITEMPIPVKYSGEYVNTSGEIGTVVDIDNPVINEQWDCYVASCKEGDVAIISGVGGSSPRLWAFLDSDYKLISQADASVSEDSLELAAPANAAWIVINDRKSGSQSYLKADANITDLENRLKAQESITESTIPELEDNFSKIEAFVGIRVIEYEFTGQWQYSTKQKVIPAGSIIQSLTGVNSLNLYDEGKTNYENINATSLPHTITHDIYWLRSETSTGVAVLRLGYCGNSDDLPTAKSDNIVKSKGIKQYVDDSIMSKWHNPLTKMDFVNTGKYVDTYGDIQDYANFYCTDYVELLGTKFYIRYLVYNNNYGVATMAFYDIDKKFILSYANIGGDESALREVGGNDLPIPKNAKYVIFSSSTNYINNSYIDIHGQKSIVQSISDIYAISGLKNKKRFKKETIASLSSGEYLSFDVPNNVNGVSISFHAKLSSFDAITIQQGESAWSTGKVKVDNTNIYVYSLNDPDTIAYTYPHGLTISTFISVRIMSELYNGTIVVSTLSGNYKVENSHWTGCGKKVKVTSNNSILTDCCLVFGNIRWEKDTWVFGDSYLTYWPAIAIRNGYGNCLFDGYPGAASTSEYDSFVKNLAYNTPKRIVWALGMNNQDSGEISPDWLDKFNKISEICLSHKIELVLVTIPNTPIRDNSYKNAFIKQSGYRYVDINEAVGADVSTEWYNGLLSSDNVHPTQDGAKVIAERFMADIPELKD